MSGGRRVEMEAKGIHRQQQRQRQRSIAATLLTTTSIIKTTTSVRASSPSQSLKCVRSGLTERQRARERCNVRLCVARFMHTIFIECKSQKELYDS